MGLMDNRFNLWKTLGENWILAQLPQVRE
jgi:hypothetical protein